MPPNPQKFCCLIFFLSVCLPTYPRASQCGPSWYGLSLSPVYVNIRNYIFNVSCFLVFYLNNNKICFKTERDGNKFLLRTSENMTVKLYWIVRSLLKPFGNNPKYRLLFPLLEHISFWSHQASSILSCTLGTGKALACCAS